VEIPAIASALRGEITGAVEWVERLALDCGELAVEFHLFSVGKLESMTGKSPRQMIDVVHAIDPTTIEDPRMRRQVEAIRELGDLDELGDLELP
jgi:hypothetical protein